MKTYHEFDIHYFQHEDGVFTAKVPAIRGCVASGKTLQEAYRNAIDAIESCLEARRTVTQRALQEDVSSATRFNSVESILKDLKR